ncbi:protein trichome birefringence-like 4 [Amborella trichopoda]|nr:protein trichome birefringence-like 4 [Amborella trichopoda]|eukprot:XP_006854129.2 protein trichome birefringence-like 4 [Amborella trichopoda]
MAFLKNRCNEFTTFMGAQGPAFCLFGLLLSIIVLLAFLAFSTPSNHISPKDPCSSSLFSMPTTTPNGETLPPLTTQSNPEGKPLSPPINHCDPNGNQLSSRSRDHTDDHNGKPLSCTSRNQTGHDGKPLAPPRNEKIPATTTFCLPKNHYYPAWKPPNSTVNRLETDKILDSYLPFKRGERRGKNGFHRILRTCDIFDGKWVSDEAYPYYEAGSCPFLDDAFNCAKNGRPDSSYEKLRWQPRECHIPRLDGLEMLERLRGKRLVYVGDSLNRNMWESMVCILRAALPDKTRVFEISGKQQFKTEGFYAFRFADYNCTVEFFRAPFLVREWKTPDPGSGARRETLRLDVIERSSSKYIDADMIIFNTGHWWTHDKTSKGKDYYQEGNHVYSELKVAEAFRRALRTWAEWVDINIDPNRTKLFFRGYSASHFRGGRWNSGGSCRNETVPISNESHLMPYPAKMSILESVLSSMQTKVLYLNITRMTDYRKDGHPSVFRNPITGNQQFTNKAQDCSHWCLPGVPDAWNELLYATLLISGRGTWGKKKNQH